MGNKHPQSTTNGQKSGRSFLNHTMTKGGQRQASDSLTKPHNSQSQFKTVDMRQSDGTRQASLNSTSNLVSA